MWIEDLRRDLAYACRSLRRTPAFTIAGVRVAQLRPSLLEIANGLVTLLEFIHGHIIGNWGIAIILLTMLVRHANATLNYTLFCFGYERRIALTTVSARVRSSPALVSPVDGSTRMSLRSSC